MRGLPENPNERLSGLVDFISLCYISVTSKDHLNGKQDPPPKDGILDCIKYVRVVEHEFVLPLTVFATGPALSGLFHWDLPTRGQCNLEP